MASSESDDDFSDDEEQDDSDCSYLDYEDDDDDEEEEEEEEDDDEEGVIGASDDDEDGSDSEYFLNDDDDDDEDDPDDEEEEEEEEEAGHEFEEDGIRREIDADDNQGLPALEHAPMEPDEISQTTDGPFSRQSTPDVSSNSLPDTGADLGPVENAEGDNTCKEIPNPDARAETDLDVEAKDESLPPPLISSLPGEMDKMKIHDPSEPSADLPANGSIDNGWGVEKTG